MDFPAKTFPYQLHDSRVKRQPFYSHGSIQNIDFDLSNESGNCFSSQKIPEGLTSNGFYLQASRPTLPLYSSPERICDENQADKVTDTVLQERQEILSLITKCKYTRGILKRTPEQACKQRFIKTRSFFYDLRRKLEELQVDEEVPDNEALLKMIPSDYRPMFGLYEKYKSVKEVKIYWLLTDTDRRDVFAHKMKRTPGDFANIQLIAID